MLAAGCGSTTHRASTTSAEKTFQRCNPNAALNPRQKRTAARITAIVRAMRHARTHDRESRLTDRFLLAIGTSSLPTYTVNRFIDHAVAASTALCQDCFQALEAARPIAGKFRCDS